MSDDDDFYFQKRVAVLRFDANMPIEWAESFARLETFLRPMVYSSEQWEGLINDAFLLWHKWSSRILANDWEPSDIKGLIPLIMGRAVINVGRGDVTVQIGRCVPEKFYRRPVLSGSARWDIGRRAA